MNNEKQPIDFNELVSSSKQHEHKDILSFLNNSNTRKKIAKRLSLFSTIGSLIVSCAISYVGLYSMSEPNVSKEVIAQTVLKQNTLTKKYNISASDDANKTNLIIDYIPFDTPVFNIYIYNDTIYMKTNFSNVEIENLDSFKALIEDATKTNIDNFYEDVLKINTKFLRPL